MTVTELESSMMFDLSESSCDPNGCIAITMECYDSGQTLCALPTNHILHKCLMLNVN